MANPQCHNVAPSTHCPNQTPQTPQTARLPAEIVQEKGVEKITVEELVSQITPKGRSLVPDAVKKELLQKIRGFLAQQSAAGN